MTPLELNNFENSPGFKTRKHEERKETMSSTLHEHGFSSLFAKKDGSSKHSNPIINPENLTPVTIPTRQPMKGQSLGAPLVQINVRSSNNAMLEIR